MCFGFIQSRTLYLYSLLRIGPYNFKCACRGTERLDIHNRPWYHLLGCGRGWQAASRGRCGRIVPFLWPPSVHILIPKSCEYFTLHGKRDFVDTITLKILRGGYYPGLPGWSSYNHRGLFKREQRVTEKDVMTEADTEVMEGHKLGDVDHLQEMEKGRKQILS